jgi:hypothetical protein
MTTRNEINYEEKRFYRKTNDNVIQYYDTLVTELVSFLDKNGAQKTLLTPEFISIFSLEHFYENVKNIIVPGDFFQPGKPLNELMAIITGDPNYSISPSYKISEESLSAGNGNSSLNNYIAKVQNLQNAYEHDDTVLESIMHTSAIDITHFFIISSILYFQIFNMNGSINLTNAPGSTGLNITINNTPVSTLYGNSNYCNQMCEVGDISQDLYISSGNVNPKDMSSAIKALYNIQESMNVRNELYLAMVHNNIGLDSDFKNQDDIIKHKEKKFDIQKSYVITMLNKNRRIQNQYSRKRIRYYIFLVLIILYILALVASVASSGSFGSIKGIPTINSDSSSYFMIGSGLFIISIFILSKLMKYFF